ncbi:MAG: hypothetical protein RL681_595 [Candidatus Parcubacteria bacterium]|jgi:methionyl-tRNA formyltransferase
MSDSLRYVLFGTPEFAAIVLRHVLDAGFVPFAVVCNPDRPQGRKKVVTPPPVKALVLQRGISTIDVVQPERLDEDFVSRISQFKPEFFVVAAYAKIIPRSVLSIPSRGVIGVHPSLLPRLRGASPIQSAILTGESTTGVSLYAMDAEMDHGPIFAAESLADYDVDRDTTATLLPRLADLGGRMLVELLSSLERGTAKAIPQDHANATFTKKFTTDDAYIPAEELAQAERGGVPELARTIHRKIRAFDPEPGAWTFMDGKRTKLLGARIDTDHIVLTKLQREGGMPHVV